MPASSSSSSSTLALEACGRRDPAVCDALADALAARPEVLRLGHQRAQLGVERDLADNQLFPGLALSAGVSQDFGPTSAPLSSSSSVWAPDPKTRGAPEAQVGLTFELPVPVRQARGRAAALSAQAERLAEQERLVRDRVAVDVDDARSAVVAAAARVDAAAAEVAAADAVLAAERARFTSGDSTILLVNLREQAAMEAALALIDATVEAQRAAIATRAATAALLDDGPARGGGPQ